MYLSFVHQHWASKGRRLSPRPQQYTPTVDYHIKQWFVNFARSETGRKSNETDCFVHVHRYVKHINVLSVSDSTTKSTRLGFHCLIATTGSQWVIIQCTPCRLSELTSFIGRAGRVCFRYESVSISRRVKQILDMAAVVSTIFIGFSRDDASGQIGTEDIRYNITPACRTCRLNSDRIARC